jgi:ribosomal protein L34E
LRDAFPGTDLGGLKQAANIERKQSKQDARVERILGGAKCQS